MPAIVDVKYRIEKFYRMPFAAAIRHHHWEKKKSLKKISDESGVHRQSIAYAARKEGIKVRSHSAAVRITPNRGSAHWAWGLRAHNSAWARAHSERMTRANPMRDPAARVKASASLAKHFRKNPFKHEPVLRKKLRALGVGFVFQHPLGPYIADFFIPSKNICIELDNDARWCREKRSKLLVRDKALAAKGFVVIRLSTRILNDDAKLTQFLRANNVI